MIANSAAGDTVWTFGHSNRPFEVTLELLRGPGISMVADVRRFPQSRHAPQYGAQALSRALGEAGIAYRHLPELGGRRGVTRGELNAGWTNLAFRGYADHMQGEEFARGIATLAEWARGGATAVMCAEAVPWRCHRSLVADALLVRGFTVLDILDGAAGGKSRPHRLTPWAVVDGTRIVYPPPPHLDLTSSGPV